MPARRIVALCLLFTVVVSATSGCAALLERRQVRLNPKYRSLKGAQPLSVVYAPVIGCPSSRTNIEPANEARANTVNWMVPDMLASLGNTEHPGFAPRHSHPDLCQQFVIGNKYPSWEGNEVLRRSAEAALNGKAADAVLFLMVSMQYRCERVYEDILAPNGRSVVGRLDRGSRCYEDGTALVGAALLTRAGEIVWHSGGKTDDKSLRGFSREWPGPAAVQEEASPPAPAVTRRSTRPSPTQRKPE